MAGLDGIQNRIDPGEPIDKDLYELPAEEAKLIKQVPGSLSEVFAALEKDHDFLLKGDVFTMDLWKHMLPTNARMNLTQCVSALLLTNSRYITIFRLYQNSALLPAGGRGNSLGLLLIMEFISCVRIWLFVQYVNPNVLYFDRNNWKSISDTIYYER